MASRTETGCPSRQISGLSLAALGIDSCEPGWPTAADARRELKCCHRAWLSAFQRLAFRTLRFALARRSQRQLGFLVFWLAQVSRHQVLADSVDHQLYRLRAIAQIDQNRLVQVYVLLLELDVVNNHRQVVRLALGVCPA